MQHFGINTDLQFYFGIFHFNQATNDVFKVPAMVDCVFLLFEI